MAHDLYRRLPQVVNRQPTLLSINNYYYRRGGAEVVFLEQNRLFEEIGWQVAPFAMRHPNNLDSPWQGYFVDEIEFGEAYSIWQKAIRAVKITYSFEARRKIAELAARVKPDVAHGHNVYHHLSPAIFGRLKALGIPTVLTLHDLKIVCPAYKMLTHDGICERCKGGAIWNVVLHRCVKNSLPLSAVIMLETAAHRLLGCYSRDVDRFVVPSRFYLEKFVEWGWPRDRFAHIPNFVDIRSHKPDNLVGDAFVFFGRLGPEKGLNTFVRAAAKAGVKVRLVGTGPEERRLRHVATNLNADVEFLGYRTGQALHEIIRRARAIVLPSEWYENAPMSVMEAYAMARPVIGARIGGIPELIRELESGLVFESGNVNELADAMTRLAEMPDKEVLAMGMAGRSWMESDFTAERYRDRLLALYSTLVT
jgi:glycosyltransferase involved in cell wall biosynthesis